MLPLQTVGGSAFEPGQTNKYESRPLSPILPHRRIRSFLRPRNMPSAIDPFHLTEFI
jgi:hypothetical protein